MGELRDGARERGGGLEGVRWVGVRRGMRIGEFFSSLSGGREKR